MTCLNSPGPQAVAFNKHFMDIISWLLLAVSISVSVDCNGFQWLLKNYARRFGISWHAMQRHANTARQLFLCLSHFEYRQSVLFMCTTWFFQHQNHLFNPILTEKCEFNCCRLNTRHDITITLILHTDSFSRKLDFLFQSKLLITIIK